jgi:hypothetical protein
MERPATVFMTRRQLMELLHIKSRETIRARLRTDPNFPRPVDGRRLWRTRDVMRYLDALQAAEEALSDVADLL